MHRADQHRFLGAFADARFDFADFDARQQRRFLVQIIRHRRQPRRDDAAGVIARAIDHIKRDRRAEIQHHHRRAKVMSRGNGIGQPVGANGVRLRIINAHADQRFRREFEQRTLKCQSCREPCLRTSGVARGTTLHSTAPSSRA